ncbi:MAG: rhomboid family intramembrane serine protease [Bryobacteraceae bacterium]|jgi:membrane associated rhomboid family serine protease
MAIGTRSYVRSYLSPAGLPPGIKWLLIVNVGIFLVQYFSKGTVIDDVLSYCALVPAAVVKLFFIWQLVTYMFLHGGIWHILWNMLALWMFGCELEQTWGTRKFLKFYFFCGVGAAFCIVALNYAFGNPSIPTVGSSGAIYGILLVSAVLWPDRIILFSFLFPIKMKYFVAIIGGIAFLNSFNINSGVSDIGHLGGMAFGYLFLKLPKTRGFDPLSSVSDGYKAWKLARAKKKFQVYLRKQRSDRGPWVN